MLNKHVSRCLLLACLFILGTTLASAQSFESNVHYLMRYYAALNQKDYAAAYGMLNEPTQTYNDFAAGFANTVRIVPYFGFEGVAAGSQYITTVLLGYQTDGTVESYYGQFQMASGGNYVPMRNNGGPVLLHSTFKLVKDGEALHTTSINELLQTPYDANRAIPQDIPHLSDMSDPWSAGVLLPYYDLINQHKFNVAYNEWLTLQQGLTRDYRLPYNTFIAGYADTDYVTVYVGYTQASTAAQMTSLVPTVLISQHVDGTVTAYSGCYAIGAFSSTHYGIVNGKFTVMAMSYDTVTGIDIINALNGLNCAALGIGA